LETIWKEDVGVQSGYKPGIFMDKLQETKKTLRDDNWYSFRNFNQVRLDRTLEQDCPAVFGKSHNYYCGLVCGPQV